MQYEAKKFEHLLGLNGFSDKALTTHFKLYQGYVTNTEKLIQQLKSIDPNTPEYAELKRRFGWEFNGMRLHEYHFGAMTKEYRELDNNSELFKKIIEDFGSFEKWEEDFKATAAMRGIGWTILYYDNQTKRLFNVWVNEHDFGHLASATLLLNLDVFEHAFFTDYTTDRASYIDAFMNVIDWNTVSQRFTKNT